MQLNGASHGRTPSLAEVPPALPVSNISPLPQGGKSFEFVINSDFLQGRYVQSQIIGEIESLKYSDGDIFAIRLALEEALINAIKHGNRMDPVKLVRIHSEVTPEAIEIVIHDQGAGFERTAVPDPTLEENLEKNCGRGIMLIEAYMTSADWTDRGRRVRMYKKREPELAQKS